MVYIGGGVVRPGWTAVTIICIILQQQQQPVYTVEACAAPPSYFFAFGTDVGDRRHDENTVDWESLVSSTPFQMESTAYNTITSSVHGLFTLTCDSCTPYDINVGFSAYDSPDHPENDDVFDRIVEDEATLQQLSYRVMEAEGCTEFVATAGYVVTWRCRHLDGEAYTFQAGLVTDSTVTYLILNYMSIPGTASIFGALSFDFDFFMTDSVYTETNHCTLKQWVFQVIVGNIFAPEGSPTCGCPLEWGPWTGQCPACGGCGTRNRARMYSDNSERTVQGPCPPKRCKRGTHSKREWLRTRKGKLIGRFRRCCWNWLKPDKPKLMRYPRRCKARRCRGWE